MRSPVVYQSQSASVHSAGIAGTYQMPGNVISICESPAYTRAAVLDSSETDRDGLGAVRGAWAAIILEAGMFLFGYALWQAWHLIR